MNWEAVTAVSGASAVVAVVLSVVYLALQVRSNTQAMYSQAHHLTTIALAETAATIASNDELSRIYHIDPDFPPRTLRMIIFQVRRDCDQSIPDI